MSTSTPVSTALLSMQASEGTNNIRSSESLGGSKGFNRDLSKGTEAILGLGQKIDLGLLCSSSNMDNLVSGFGGAFNDNPFDAFLNGPMAPANGLGNITSQIAMINGGEGILFSPDQSMGDQLFVAPTGGGFLKYSGINKSGSKSH